MEQKPQQNQDQKQPLPKGKFTRPNVARRHKKILENLGENGGNMRQAILDAGLSQKMADNPQRITESKTWNELLDQEFPDADVNNRHKQLLNAKRLERIQFPSGPKLTANKIPGSEDLSDEEIREMYAEADCNVYRIVHHDKFREVYFGSPDNLARDKALDKLYKIKGRYADEVAPKPGGGNTYNFIFSAPVQEKIKVLEGEIKDMLIKKPDANNQQN